MEKKPQNTAGDRNEDPTPQGSKWPGKTIIRYITRALVLLIVFAWALVRAWDTPKIAVCPDSGCACCPLKPQYPQIVMSPLFRKRGHFFFSDT